MSGAIDEVVKGVQLRGKQGDAAAQTAAEPPEVPVRDMIPYLAFHCDVTDEHFKQLVGQLKPWGVPMFVYHRRDNMRHLETWSQIGIVHGTRVTSQHGPSIPEGWGYGSCQTVSTCSCSAGVCTTTCYAHAPINRALTSSAV